MQVMGISYQKGYKADFFSSSNSVMDFFLFIVKV